MSSPSKPVSIKSPRFVASNVVENVSISYPTPIGTPDLRALRAQYVGTPPPNIPPRGNAISSRDGSPMIGPADSVLPHQRSIAGISGRQTDTPASGVETPIHFDLDGLPDEEKAKVLRRHLVSKDERHRQAEGTPNAAGSDPNTPSRPPSANSKRQRRKDSELFPVPYDTHGADITYVSCPPSASIIVDPSNSGMISINGNQTIEDNPPAIERYLSVELIQRPKTLRLSISTNLAGSEGTTSYCKPMNMEQKSPRAY